MKVKIPEWAVECNDENWIVLFWFLRSLTISYPPYKNKQPGDIKRPDFIYSMLATDFNTLTGSRIDHHIKIATWPLMRNQFKLGIVSNNDYSCRMVTWHKTVTKELKTSKIWKVVKRYLATAEDFPEVHPDYIEGAKDMIAEDIIIFERLEEYERCSILKKAYQQLEQLK